MIDWSKLRKTYGSGGRGGGGEDDWTMGGAPSGASSTGTARTQPIAGSTVPASGGSYDWDMPSTNPYGAGLAFDYSDPGAANIKQQWYRQSGWGGYPGQVVWNPYYGWQDQEAVKNYYQTQTGPVSWDQFTTSAPFKKQTAGDWSDYYAPNRYTAGGSYTDPSTGYTYSVPGDVYTGTSGSHGQGGAGGDIWNIISQALGETGYSGYTNPWQHDLASEIMSYLGMTGGQVSTQPWYEANRKWADTQAADAIKQSNELAGMSGQRYSTPTARSAQDITNRYQQAINSQYAGLDLQSGENAANRSLQAAGGLSNLADQAQSLPMNYATGLFNMGSGMTNQYNQMLGSLQNEWMRTQPEYSPWMQYLSGLLGSQGQYAQQQYQPSWLSQLLGVGTSILPFLSSGGSKSSSGYQFPMGLFGGSGWGGYF